MVSTDVGSCRELLQGRAGEDRELGDAGILTGLADPEATARALLELRNDPDRRVSMGRIGRQRVERYYRLDQVRDAYRNLYRSLSDVRH